MKVNFLVKRFQSKGIFLIVELAKVDPLLAVFRPSWEGMNEFLLVITRQVDIEYLKDFLKVFDKDQVSVFRVRALFELANEALPLPVGLAEDFLKNSPALILLHLRMQCTVIIQTQGFLPASIVLAILLAILPRWAS